MYFTPYPQLCQNKIPKLSDRNEFFSAQTATLCNLTRWLWPRGWTWYLAVYIYKWMIKCGPKVRHRIVITEIIVRYIPLPNIQTSPQRSIEADEPNTTQISVSGKGSTFTPHLRKPNSAVIIQSADSECCHSLWLCEIRGFSPYQPLKQRGRTVQRTPDPLSRLSHILWTHKTARQQPALACRLTV